MKKALILLAASLLMTSSAFAVPDLQLFIAGGTYDVGSETWVTTARSFDLWVISANEAHDNVFVSMALAPTDNPGAISVLDDGNAVGGWINGWAPSSYFPDEWNGGNNDLPQHGIFPTWFTEVNTGDYGTSGHVGNAQPGGWDPSTNTGSAPAIGQARVFHIDVGGTFTFIHFDAFTVFPDRQGHHHPEGSIDEFAPFSHDAQVNFVPEPGTLALFAPGLLGLAGILIRKKKA